VNNIGIISNGNGGQITSYMADGNVCTNDLVGILNSVNLHQITNLACPKLVGIDLPPPKSHSSIDCIQQVQKLALERFKMEFY